ncbi:DNA primase/polymerase [Microbacterium phage Alleb]|nr:DNA primase/polymerase [Microbacterium phage Alleb]
MSFQYDVDPFKLIAQGISIFPCDPGDKRPAAKNPSLHPVKEEHRDTTYRLKWADVHTTDETTVERWVREYPGCFWGTPTGDVNGFITIDLDTYADDTVADWWDEHWFAPGSEVSTLNGGRHERYAVEPGEDIQTNRAKLHNAVDVRAEGGYIVAYTDDYSDIPPIPDDLLAFLPKRTQVDEEAERAEAAAILASEEKAQEVTPQEARVLKGITDKLDALPRPWHKGAGYHEVQFGAACHLWRIVNNTRDYATTEADAYALFVKHAPLRDANDRVLRDKRWREAKEYAAGQMADPPGETPIRLENIDELLSKFPDSEVERLFWESKNIGGVKKLIHALRLQGADEQEAYSISYACAGMKAMRDRGVTTSTWGFVKAEYEVPVIEDEQAFDDWDVKETVKKLEAPKDPNERPLVLLTDEERAIVRDYPNFIDYYIDAAKTLYSEPNLPLHYVNAWIALSVGIGDKASIYATKGRMPCSLWGLLLAPSAAGKSDANALLRDTVDAMRKGGFSGVNMGDDASAEQLMDVMIERANQTSGIFMDECREFLENAKKPGGSYEKKALGAYLKLYDGTAERQLRRGMDKSQVGETAEVSFTLWMQGAWNPVIETMDTSHIESGFVGRFLVAVGGDAKVTRESLSIEFANEYQVENGGRHPMIDSFANAVRENSKQVKDGRITFASKEVHDRWVDMRVAMDEFSSKHPLSDGLRGVLLRVGMNVLKGAGLLALSEGREKIEMEDLLLAIKSGEYWVKGSVELAEAISASGYRRLVDHVVDLVTSRGRSEAAILKSPRFQNMKRFEVMDIVERAEKEGRIRLNGGVWEAV